MVAQELVVRDRALRVEPRDLSTNDIILRTTRQTVHGMRKETKTKTERER